MKRSNRNRLLSWLLIVAMVLSLVPMTALAADAVYTQITKAEDLTTGQYVLAAGTHAATVLDGGWVLSTEVEAKDGKLTNPASDTVWNVTVKNGKATLTDSNGVSIAPKGANANGIKSGSYEWTVTVESGLFKFSAETEAVTLACNTTGNGNNNSFRAYKNTTVAGQPQNYVATLTLYKLETGTKRESGLITADKLQQGDTVVIFNPAKGKALSSEYSNFYNKGTDVTLTEGKLTGYTDAELWTVGLNEDGTFTFATAEGKKLSMDTSYSSTPLDKANTAWAISNAKTESCVYIQNVGRSAYLEWFDSKGSWSGYGTITDTTEELFAQQLYLVVKESGTDPTEPTPTDPEPTDPTPTEPEPAKPVLKDGQEVVIYNPANGKTLSTEYANFYNKANDVTVEGGKLTGWTDVDVWTVGVNADGTYTFSTADGQKLSMDTSYTSTPLDKVHSSWKITAVEGQEGLYYIDNTGRTDKYRLQYYAEKGTWSAYTGTGENFQQAFYVVNRGPLTDGGKYVIYNPANGKTLSTEYANFYNKANDVTMKDGKLTGWTSVDVWTVSLNEDGTYSFATAEGKKLSMDTSYTSTPLDKVYSSWKVTAVEGADGLYFIDNTGRTDKYRLQFYVDKGTWSAYTGTGENFQQAFYPVTGEPDVPGSDLPKAGDQVLIYNLSAQGVLAGQDGNTESPAINPAEATIEDGKAVAANGARVFTVEKNGEYYRFYNEYSGYLCSNGTGNNAFYTQTASEDADWTLAAYNGGFSMESRTAKFNGRYSQFMEYFGGAFKSYSMYNVTDPDIYTFQFYPCGNETVTKGVVNQPTVTFSGVLPAYVGQDYNLTMTVEAVFGVDVPYTMYRIEDSDGTPITEDMAGEVDLELLSDENNVFVYNVTIFDTAIARITGDKMTLRIGAKDTTGVAFTGSVDIEVKNEPVIADLTPAAGSQTGENKRPEISASVINAGENPTVVLTVNGETVEAAYENGKVRYTPAGDLADGKVTVTLTVTREDGKSASRTWSFTVGTAQYQLYFGQLHSHTQYSDGAGTLDAALAYVENLPESANVQFVAFTDHSNYFDNQGGANPEGALYDMSLASAYSQERWSTYKNTVAAFNASHSDVVAIGGFEMTWSGGPGHINTFNTPGIVSRNNTTLNNKTSDAGMKAYYKLLSQEQGVNSLSQFNHPGTTFGNFTDFSYYDAVIDSRMFLVEVGNGEGAIGAGGYYPSYEQYIMALDKGWHVAPTNNQDNHKGKWGNANDARDVILTDDFSEQGLYAAIRQLRVYATEDKNLELRYSVNGYELGSVIEEVPEKLDFNISFYDPDASDSIVKVELVSNAGKVAYTCTDPAVLAKGEINVTLDPTYSYYFVRVTQGDGDLAVTAPVWVGESLKVGISKVECGTSTPVTNEELTLTTTLFNSEASDATVKSVTYTKNGSVVIGTDTTSYTLAASSTQELTFNYTPTEAKVEKITVTVVLELDGEEYTFTKDITLDILDADSMVYIGIDASHYNEYVAGNYKDSMGNFSELAAKYSVRTVELKTSEDLIAACANDKYKALILTAPSRRLAEAQADPRTYSAEELAAITAFNAKGGTVILAGWSDHYEDYPDALPAGFKHMAATQNEVLEALGSQLRISDDATYDDVRSAADGVDKWRLYFNTYGKNLLTEGVIVDAEHPYDRLYTEVFSHYGGASIYTVDASGSASSVLPADVSPVVFGHSSTYSLDTDKDGLGGDSTPKYTYADGDDRLMVMAMEQRDGKGMVVVSGAAFMSNFEVQAQISDNGSEKNYSNYKICENLLRYLNPVKVTPIAEVQAEKEEGVKFTIEGTVTSNASGYDTRTAFFDCIYLQDDTAGINAFPVAGNYKIGDRVRITGTTSSYQGERQIAVTAIELLGQGEAVEPVEITAEQLNDGSVLGSLVTLKGTVASFEKAEGLVQTIMVRDASGKQARVFIDGYICTDEDVKDLTVGAAITVTGLASYDESFAGPAPRIRVRNRAEVVCVPSAQLPFEDVKQGHWFYEAVAYGYFNGLFNGISETEFAPNTATTRAMVVTVLYRMAGQPAVEGEVSFTDVADNWYCTDAIIWAAENGIALGYPDGTFLPGQNVTREELAVFLYRFAKLAGADMSLSGDLETFTDGKTVAPWAQEGMRWCVGAGLFRGDETGALNPCGAATRAEYATLVMRLLESGVLPEA